MSRSQALFILTYETGASRRELRLIAGTADQLRRRGHAVIEVTAAPSRLAYVVKKVRRKFRSITHLTFTPLDSVYLLLGVRNVAYVEKYPGEEGRLRAEGFDELVVPEVKLRNRLQRSGLTPTIVDRPSDEARSKHRRVGAEAPLPKMPRARRPIFVEVTPLFHRQFTGIHRWIAQFLLALSQHEDVQLGIVDKKGKYWRVGSVPRKSRLKRGVSLEQWAETLWSKRRRLRPNELESSTGVYPCLRPGHRLFGREISILYDFTTFIVPWSHHSIIRDQFNEQFRHAFSLNDAVVSTSQSTLNDARWLLPEIVPRTRVLESGPSQCAPEHASLKKKIRRKPTILVVSSVEPRKNAAFTVEWFAQTRVLPPEFELKWVGAGPRGMMAERDVPWLLDLAVSFRKAEGKRFEFLGNVSDAHLCDLYREATFTLYPSIYEGFGFPVLDSLWHGAPAACGYHSSLIEFAQPGIEYFDPYDMASLDRAVEKILKLPRLGNRRKEISRRYSWDRLVRHVNHLCH